MAENNMHREGGYQMKGVVRFCPKCKKQAAEYRYNKAGNLAFVGCINCGYSAEDYARDLKEKG
jgi:Zn ribbon nucleic-acid-binding protein